MGVITFRRDELPQLVKLAVGGQARLYQVPGLTIPGEPSRLVYKEYKPSIAQGKKSAIRSTLTALARIRDNTTGQHRLVLDGRSAWPLAVVVDNYGATGLIMREIPSRFFFELKFGTGTVARKPAELMQFLQKPADRVARGFLDLDEQGRAVLMARIIRTMKVFHDIGVVVGDFSSGNVLVYVDPDDRKGSPFFVDTDSFRIDGALPAIHQPHTPDWETPESLRNGQILAHLRRSNADANALGRARAAALIQDKPSDVYKVALLAHRIFDNTDVAAIVRRSGIAERKLEKMLGKSRAAVVEAALSPNPRERPTMTELERAFR